MHPSMFLLAVVVLAVPSRAIMAVNEDAAHSRVLYALNIMQTPGMEHGRFYDAAMRRAWRTDVDAATFEGTAGIPPTLVKRTGVVPTAPFVLEVPKVPPPPFQRTFKRLMGRKETNGYDELIHDDAERLGLDARLVKAVIAAESEFTRRAKSPAGALGLMQVKPATAAEMGVSGRTLFDPAANIRAGTRYLAYLFSRAWERYHLRGVAYTRAPAWIIQRVIAAYNAGPRWIKQRPVYRETREYVKKVLLYYKSEVSALRGGNKTAG